ncbi:hypothetical protein [Changchengzhania lutea]|uniref:hypothetical protein n=1 Tax=Changchengzhania lutea TaxID=2049305 RepID=UPI00115F4505|nr:hypothetical protein [Changchengzhania lutea]
MKTYEMSFGTISILKSDLAEVIVSEGVDMNVDQAKEYLNFVFNNLKSPFSILVNRKHAYTYNFEAQKLIVNNDKIKNLAVVIGTNGGLIASESLLSLNKNIDWNTKYFRTREDAISWLNLING